jgi:hypothetical protein
VVHIATKEVVHGSTMETLSLRHRAVLVCKEQCLQINNLFAQLCDCRRQSVILSTEQLDLGL